MDEEPKKEEPKKEKPKIWDLIDISQNEKKEFSFILFGHGWWLQHLKFVNEINKSFSNNFEIKEELINQMDKLKISNFADNYFSIYGNGFVVNNIFEKGGKILTKNNINLVVDDSIDISKDVLACFSKGEYLLINFCALFFYDLLKNAKGYYENWFENLKKHKTKNLWNKFLRDFIDKANTKYINEDKNLYFMKYTKIRIKKGDMIFIRNFNDINSPQELNNNDYLYKKYSLDYFSYEKILGIINVLFSSLLFTTEKFWLISEFTDENLNENLKVFSRNINKEIAKDGKENININFIYTATTNYVQPNFPSIINNSLFNELNERIVFLHGKFVNNGNFPFIKGIENIKINYKKYTDQMEIWGKDNVNDNTSFFNLYIYGLSSINEDYLIKEVVNRKCWRNIYISFFKEEDKEDWKSSLNKINPSLLEKTKFIKSESWWIEDKDGKVFSKF